MSGENSISSSHSNNSSLSIVSETNPMLDGNDNTSIRTLSSSDSVFDLSHKKANKKIFNLFGSRKPDDIHDENSFTQGAKLTFTATEHALERNRPREYQFRAEMGLVIKAAASGDSAKLKRTLEALAANSMYAKDFDTAASKNVAKRNASKHNDDSESEKIDRPFGLFGRNNDYTILDKANDNAPTDKEIEKAKLKDEKAKAKEEKAEAKAIKEKERAERKYLRKEEKELAREIEDLKDIYRSEQKQTLAVWRKYFPKLSAADQTEILMTFVDKHIEHLLFDQTTERDALQRGIQDFGHWLLTMQDQEKGRPRVASALIEKIIKFDTGEHGGIKNAWVGHLCTLAGIAMFATIIGIPAAPAVFRYGDARSGKESKNRNKGVTLVDRELLHMRTLYLNRKLSKADYLKVTANYKTLQESLTGAHGKKIEHITQPDKRDVTWHYAPYKYTNPENWDKYRKKKENGALDEKFRSRFLYK
jgi:hypothetical protein